MRQYPNSTWSLAQIPHILLEVPEVTRLRYKILSTAKKIFLAQNEHCTQELQFNLSCKKSLNALFWISLLSSITILPIWSTPILWCCHHHPNSTIRFLLPWHHTFIWASYRKEIQHLKTNMDFSTSTTIIKTKQECFSNKWECFNICPNCFVTYSHLKWLLLATPILPQFSFLQLPNINAKTSRCQNRKVQVWAPIYRNGTEIACDWTSQVICGS